MMSSSSFQAAQGRAVQAHRSGNFENVVYELQSFINECLEFPQSAFLLIHGLLRTNQSYSAEKLAKAYLSKDAAALDIVKVCALIYKQRGQNRLLVRSLKHLLIFDPSDAGTHIMLLANLAVPSFNLSPHLASRIFCLGVANPDVLGQLVQNQTIWPNQDRTLAMARRAVLLEPSKSKPLANFLMAFGVLSITEPVIPSWCYWLLTIDPKSEKNHLLLARRFEQIGHQELALKILSKAHQRVPESQALKIELLAMSTLAKRYDLVSRILGPRRQAEPGEIEGQAIAMVSAGRLESAIRFLENRLAENDDFALRRRVAWIYFDDYRFEEAYRHTAILAHTAPDEIQRNTYEAFMELGRGNPEKADAIFEQSDFINGDLTAQNYRVSQSDMMRVSQHFHESLYDTPFRNLVPVRYVGPSDMERSRVLVTVDQDYLDQFFELILTNAQKVEKFQVHIHVICPRDLSQLEALGYSGRMLVTFEEPDLKGWSVQELKAYYSCIRFIRAWQMLENGEVDRIAIVDVDTEWLNPISTLFDLVEDGSMALFHDASAPPWAKLNATCGVYSSDPDITAFLRHVAQYIWWFLSNRQARWRLDQCALYCSLLHFKRDLNSALKFDNLSAHLPRLLRDTRGKADRSAIVDRARLETTMLHSVADAFSKNGGDSRRIIELLSMGLAATPDDDGLKERICRLMLQVGDLKGFLELTPPGGHEFWLEKSRDDLKASKRSIEQFLKLNDLFMEGEVADNEPWPAPASLDTEQAKIFKHISNAILVKEPFHFFQIDEFLPPEAYSALANHVSTLPVAWGEVEPYTDRGTITRADLIQDSSCAKLMKLLESREFLNCIIHKLGAAQLAELVREDGFDLRPSLKFTIDRRNYSLGPHKDHPNRFASGLFYFPTDEPVDGLGTCLYRRKNPRWTLDNGLHGKFEDFELVRQIDYRANTGLVFLNFGNSYHGVEPVIADARRVLLQYTIYRSNRPSEISS